MTRKDDLPTAVHYTSDLHTRLKHTFHRRDVACWMGKILQGKYASPGTIVDGFAGGGARGPGVGGEGIGGVEPGAPGAATGAACSIRTRLDGGVATIEQQRCTVL